MTSRTLHHVLTTMLLAPALAVTGLLATGTPADAAAAKQRAAGHKLVVPVKPGQFRISQGFHAGHDGIDLAAPVGTRVRAVAGGRVTTVHKWNYSYGKHVVIKHRGSSSLYAHMSRINVHKGQKIKRGQVIGRVGSTGNSTGPHLHFVLKKHGRSVNPARFILR